MIKSEDVSTMDSEHGMRYIRPTSGIPRGIILCVAILALLTFIVTSVGFCVLYFFYTEHFDYNTEEMRKLQPHLIRTVRSLLEMQDRSDPDPSSAFENLSNANNATCYSTACLKTSLDLLESMDFSTNPCEDFYQFSCGGWMKKNPSVSTALASDQFNIINEKVINITEEILSTPLHESDNRPLRQAKKFYKECVDVDLLETKGLEQVLLMLTMYGGWPLLFAEGEWKPSPNFDWIRMISDLQKMTNPAIIGIDIKQNPGAALAAVIFKNDTSKFPAHVIRITQPLFFVSREYLIDPVKNQKLFSAYKEFIVNVGEELSRADDKKPDLERLEQVADSIIKFECSLARISLDEENRFNNLKKHEDLVKLQQETDLLTTDTSRIKIRWRSFLSSVFSTSGIEIKHSESVVLQESQYFTNLVKILNEVDEETISNYLLWRMVAKLATGTTASMRNFSFEFHKKIYGIEYPRRESTCSSLANERFGNVIGLEYIRTNFDPSVKLSVNALANAVKLETQKTIEKSVYLHEGLKLQIMKKLDDLRNCIGFPEAFDNITAVLDFYNDLVLSEGSYLKNWMHLTNWLFDKNLKRLRNQFDNNCWGGSYWTYIGEAYAYYDTARKSINFPVGILQEPFYRKGAPSYVNSGAIGSIIGHEITHSFNLEGWIRLKIEKKLESVEKCLVDHFSRFEVPEAGPNSKVDGYRTRAENFADHIGLAQAYAAFKTTDPQTESPRILLPSLERFTPGQLFFVAFTNMWCVTGSKEWLYDELEVSVHTPAKFRVLGTLQNSLGFHREWKCPKNTFMNPDTQDGKCATI